MPIDPSQIPVAKTLATPVADTQGSAADKPAATVIGKVDKLQGDAWIVHDGQKVPAKIGAALMQGDSVETAQGAQISLVFADRTTFVLKDKGLVGLDEFSYDPATKTGKETFVVAQGAFSFVSGDIAKTQPDAARLATPVMTMGIRGTTVGGTVAADGNTSVALLPDPGSNFVGEVAISALGGGQSFTLNSAGSGIVGASSGSSWSVSANAGAAIASSMPAPAPPPPNPPVLNGQTGQTGTGNTGNGETHNTAPDPVPLPPQPVGLPNPNPEPKPELPKPEPPKPDPPKPDQPRTDTPTQNHDPTTSDVTLAGSTAGTSITFSKSELLANARDRDGDTLSIKLDSGHSDHGTAVVNADGSITFTATAGYSGAATITYTISDGHGGSVQGTAFSAVTVPVNHAPTSSGVTNATASDHAGLSVGTITASDADGDTLAYHLQGGTTLDATHDTKVTSHGTVTLDTTDGTFTFTPGAAAASMAAGATATDTASVMVSDGNGGTLTTSIGVDITGINDAPTRSGTVNLGTATASITGTISIASLVGNASDAEGDSLTLTAVSVDNGTASIVGTDVVYTPTNGYTGPLTFTYTVSDGHGGTVTDYGTLSLAANHAPVSNATAALMTLAEDTPTNMSGTWLKSQFTTNATDADGDTLTVTNIAATHGTLTLLGDGSYTFVPDANFNGTATLTATISDGHGGTTTGLATIIYTPDNDAPTNSATPVALGAGGINTGMTISIASLVANATDVDGDSLTVSTISALHGTATISGANILYTPDTNYTGTETFSYTISDSHGGTVGGSATMDVLPLLTQSGTVLHSNTAAVLTDADFNGFSGANTLVFDVATGTQGVTLGTYSAATGIMRIDASGTSGGVVANGSASSTAISFTGGSGNDTFYGGSGADSFLGGGGNDVIHGASNDALIDGGTGTANVLSIDAVNFDDTIYNNNQIQNIQTINITNATTAGQWFKFDDQNDGFTINVTSTQNVTIQGSQGNDVINGGAGGEYLFGDQGDDTLSGGQGNDTLVGGAGTDVALYSSNAVDSLLTASGGTLSVAAQSGSAGTDKLTGIETLTFSDGSFAISASGTTLTALGASSTLTVGSGIAEVVMGSGTNKLVTDMATLSAGLSILGGAGLDTVVISDTASMGSVQMPALTGIETLTLASSITAAQSVYLGGQAESAGLNVVDASAATGAVEIHGASRSDDLTLTGGSGNDTIHGAAGNDTLVGGGGSNTIDAGTGTDTVSYGSMGSGITATLNGSSALVTHSANTDTVTNTEILRGSGHDDVFFVASASVGVTVDGGAGVDTMDYSAMGAGITATVTGTSASVVHAGGTDAITNVEAWGGSAHDDTFIGDSGSDTFFGGIGADHLTGGGGADTFVYTDVNQSQDGASVRDVITDFTSGTDHINIALSGTHVDVSGFEVVASYNAGQSSLTGGVARTGGVEGDGFYSTFDQALYIYQGSTDSGIGTDGGYVIGSTATITATDLNFNITGTAGNDTLVGGMGNDILAGGTGTNTLTGGGGADTFVLDAGLTSTAVITDFNSAVDNIMLSNGSFGLGSSGTLTAGTVGATYAEGTTSISSTAQDFGDSNAGIVAIQNGANVELWHTANMGAADSTNSTLVGTLNNVNTSALDQTSFHLAV